MLGGKLWRLVHFGTAAGVQAIAVLVFNTVLVGTTSAEDYGVYAYQFALSFIIYALFLEPQRLLYLREGIDRTETWSHTFKFSFFCSFLLALIFYYLELVPLFFALMLYEYSQARSRTEFNGHGFVSLQFGRAMCVFIVAGGLLSYPDGVSSTEALMILMLTYLTPLIVFRTYKNDGLRKNNINETKRLLKLSVMLLPQSLSMVFLCYVDRLLLDMLNFNTVLPYSSYLSELSRQFVLFPMSILNVLMFKDDVHIFTSGLGVTRTVLIRSISVLFSSIIAIAFLFSIVFWSPDLIDVGYISFIGDNYIFYVMAYALIAIKLYIVDVFFIIRQRYALSFFSGLASALLYCFAYVYGLEKFGVDNLGVIVFISALVYLLITIIFNAWGEYFA